MEECHMHAQIDIRYLPSLEEINIDKPLEFNGKF